MGVCEDPREGWSGDLAGRFTMSASGPRSPELRMQGVKQGLTSYSQDFDGGSESAYSRLSLAGVNVARITVRYCAY